MIIIFMPRAVRITDKINNRILTMTKTEAVVELEKAVKKWTANRQKPLAHLKLTYHSNTIIMDHAKHLIHLMRDLELQPSDAVSVLVNYERRKGVFNPETYESKK